MTDERLVERLTNVIRETLEEKLEPFAMELAGIRRVEHRIEQKLDRFLATLQLIQTRQDELEKRVAALEVHAGWHTN